MKRLLAVIPLVLVLVLAGCGSSTILTGVWVDDAENIYQFDGGTTLNIRRNDPDDKALREGMSCTYELTPDNDDAKSLTGRIRIIITPQQGKSTETGGNYKLDEDKTKLTITGDDGSISVLTKSQ